MQKRKKISFRETLLTKKKTNVFHAIYYQLLSYSIFYSNKMFFKYATLGIAGSLAHIIVLVILTQLGVYYLISAIIGIALGIYINYILNKKFIVKEREQHQKKINKTFTFIYFAVSALSIVFNIYLLFIFVEVYLINYLLANIISSFLMFLTRYFSHRILFTKFGH